MIDTRRISVNLSLDAALVAQARAYDLNLSQISRNALRQAVKAEAAARWRAENAAAIEAYNRRIDMHGMFSDHVPGWWNGSDGAV